MFHSSLLMKIFTVPLLDVEFTKKMKTLWWTSVSPKEYIVDAFKIVYSGASLLAATT